jgi:RNA polymerase sigma-70 factor (ECF subfamily)
MYSVFLSQYRKQKREQKLAVAWGTDPNVALAGSVSTQLGLLPGLQRALDGLPQVYGRTLCLVDLEECSYQEAACTLGVPIGTVMSRLHRARRLLGQQLAAQAA